MRRKGQGARRFVLTLGLVALLVAGTWALCEGLWALLMIALEAR